MANERPDEGGEAWQPSKPPPPMPKFDDIPESLKEAARGGVKDTPSGLTGIGKGWAMALDFIGSIIAAWLIGFGIDWWQKTTPWGSLIGLGIGFAYAIYRILKQTRDEERKGK